MISPAGVMPKGAVPWLKPVPAPGASNVVTVPSLARRKPSFPKRLLEPVQDPARACFNRASVGSGHRTFFFVGLSPLLRGGVFSCVHLAPKRVLIRFLAFLASLRSIAVMPSKYSINSLAVTLAVGFP